MEIKCNQVRVRARIRADRPAQPAEPSSGGMSNDAQKQAPQAEHFSNTVNRVELQDLLCQLESDIKRHIEFRFARQGKEKRP
ncbi:MULTISPECIES: hypothetical protein [Pseudoalteromonas]|uniref:Uncharacterized protein n=1 Tax=Pseudoalteromonas obscura TaxID=3048491 RepID=A0ABT7EFG4_9GAMM|nr:MULTISPECIES: hypothetical protein [Pseudoalteromonas]MBQ4839616.1 hypothetical protein [Pseudoalteromonas luteoviolacea]MDK2593778.1 hypothetical protein [Pseudoalteromonas sp. P94(2023)]